MLCTAMRHNAATFIRHLCECAHRRFCALCLLYFSVAGALYSIHGLSLPSAVRKLFTAEATLLFYYSVNVFCCRPLYM